MTDAQTILDMIEAVDPADTAGLDEIDARVDCYLARYSFVRMELSVDEKVYRCQRDNGCPHLFTPLSYTRSRDALKSIRPEGWEFSTYTHLGESECRLNKPLVYAGYSRKHPTEELAELHPIIQARVYDCSATAKENE